MLHLSLNPSDGPSTQKSKDYKQGARGMRSFGQAGLCTHLKSKVDCSLVSGSSGFIGTRRGDVTCTLLLSPASMCYWITRGFGNLMSPRGTRAFIGRRLDAFIPLHGSHGKRNPYHAALTRLEICFAEVECGKVCFAPVLGLYLGWRGVFSDLP